MKYINLIVEGSTEETFVNDVLVKHFALIDKFVSARKIKTGWDRLQNKPAKGGLLKFDLLRNDILRWIQADRNKPDTWYTTFVDLYAFPKDAGSPYTQQIQNITDHYQRITALENGMSISINHPNFIPYIQLHEFETFLLAEPNRLLTMYPDAIDQIGRLKANIGTANPEEINESPNTSPSKRIIRYIPEFEAQKAQVGPLVAEDIGLHILRQKCPHFGDWITKLESL